MFINILPTYNLNFFNPDKFAISAIITARALSSVGVWLNKIRNSYKVLHGATSSYPCLPRKHYERLSKWWPLTFFVWSIKILKKL
jgi:hypothetical protein